MPNSSAVFPGYNFVLYLKKPGGGMQPLGGFSQSTGQATKIPGTYKVGDVTLKRGVVNSSALFDWLGAARAKTATGLREAILTQRGANNVPITSWKLSLATPTKYSGPPLGGNANDVAIEELILATERIEIVPPH